MKKVVFILIVIVLSIQIYADFDFEWYEGNELIIELTNYGIFGHDITTGNSGAYWPSDYLIETYIFGAGIWFGGLIDTSGDTLCDTLVSVGYNPSSGVTEFVPGLYESSIYNNPENIVYFSNSDNNGYGWPIKKTNGDDSLVSMIDAFCQFNDKDSSRHLASENLPLDLEISQYGYEWPSPFLKNIKFIKYVVKNARTDGKAIKNAYLSITADNDIGNEAGSAANDLLGFVDTITTNYGNYTDTLIQLNTVYQFQLDLEAGWHDYPAIISYVLLKTPVATDSIDLYHNGSFIIEPGQEIGLTSLNSFTFATDPTNKVERYLVLAGYDHTIFDSSNPEASYDPFPNWGTGTTGYPGQSESSVDADDKRFALATGPFTLQSGDSVEYVFAICMNQSEYEIVPNASNLIYFWNHWEELIGNRLSITNPAEDTTITSNCNIEWATDTILDSFYFEINNKYQDTSYSYKGTNTYSYNFDPSVLADGYYEYYICNYDSVYIFLTSFSKNIIIDNPNQNGNPIIFSFAYTFSEPYVYLNWSADDPEHDILQYDIQIIGDNQELNYTLQDTFLEINAYQLLPNGNYTITLIATDDSLTSDTNSTNISIDINRANDDINNIVSGDNNLINIKALTYNVDNVQYNNYYIFFQNPFHNNYYLYMPYIVYDSTSLDTALFDTIEMLIYYTGVYDTYYSPIFDGIGLEFTIDSYYYGIYDSIKVINDVGNPYVDSVLQIVNYDTTYNSLSGRNLFLYWHVLNDSLYADIVVENYNDTLQYDSVYQFNYYYGISSNFSDYIDENDTTQSEMYIPSGKIYFNKPASLSFPMDSTMRPEEGEIWEVYSSGGRLPIKGDVYTFTPSGIEDKNNNAINQMSCSQYIVKNEILFNIYGNNNEFDINIYDIQGRKIKNVFKGIINGNKQIKARINMPNGVYFIKDSRNKELNSVKFILMK